MDWSKRGAWLYQGSSPDYPKLAAHQIGTIYVDSRAGNAKAVIADGRAKGLQAGFYDDPHWIGGLTPQAYAKHVSDLVQVAKLVVVGDPVMVDLEMLPLAWLDAFVPAVRAYLPSRPLSITIGPGQDSSIVPAATLTQYGVHLYVQLYHGGMEPAPATEVWPSNDDLLNAGLQRSLLHPFYDGAAVPWNAKDGCVFTMERLP